MKTYAGIGSRKTPPEILIKMFKLAERLQIRYGYTLRSGGADGADLAFEGGADSAEENGHDRMKEIFFAKDSNLKAKKIAGRYHPYWNSLGPHKKMLHGRNSMQVLGKTLDDPVDFVLCWTPDGCEEHGNRTVATGGTGTAISIASEYDIPVFNLYNKDAIQRLKEFLHD